MPAWPGTTTTRPWPSHGAQYVSRAFADLCDQLGVTRSMGAIGSSADNAACESFHASLKRETLQGALDYGDRATCRRTVFAWLARYNTRRQHSANGHLSPTNTNTGTTRLSSRWPHDIRIRVHLHGGRPHRRQWEHLPRNGRDVLG